MAFLRYFLRKLRLAPKLLPKVAGAIALSLLLIVGIPLLNQKPTQAQQTFTGIPAPKRPYYDRLMAAIDQDGDRLKEIFKDIHQNPELGFMETRTAGIMAEELRTDAVGQRLASASVLVFSFLFSLFPLPFSLFPLLFPPPTPQPTNAPSQIASRDTVQFRYRST